MREPLAALHALVAGEDVPSTQGLAAAAAEHRLIGLLSDAAVDGRAQLSEADMRVVIAADMANRAHHQRLWSALRSASNTLADIGVEAAAIKGVTNETRWYSRLGARPCSDVDLVIAPHDIDRLDEILAVLTPDYPMPRQATGLVRRRLLQHVHFEWQGVTLDLHFDPLKLGVWMVSPDSWWSTTEVLEQPHGGQVRVLSREMALIGALTHLNKDRFAYLGAYAEVARIATDPALDWPTVQDTVAEQDLDVPVWKSLGTVVDELNLDLAVPPVFGWRATLWDRLWPPESRLLGNMGRHAHPHRQMMIPMLMTHRTRDAAAEWQRFLFPSKALLDVATPELRAHSALRRLTLDRLRRGVAASAAAACEMKSGSDET